MAESQVEPDCLLGQEVLLSVGVYADCWGIVRAVLNPDLFVIEAEGDRQTYARNEFRTHAQCALPQSLEL